MMTTQSNNSDWLRVRVSGPDAELIILSLARSRGIPARKGPRTRSAVSLQCPLETLEGLITEAKRVGLVLDYYKCAALDALLETCGANLTTQIRSHIAKLETCILVDPRLAVLHAHVGRRFANTGHEYSWTQPRKHNALNRGRGVPVTAQHVEIRRCANGKNAQRSDQPPDEVQETMQSGAPRPIVGHARTE